MKGNGVDYADISFEMILTATGGIVWAIAAWRALRWLLDLPAGLAALFKGETRSSLAKKELMAELRARARARSGQERWRSWDRSTTSPAN